MNLTDIEYTVFDDMLEEHGPQVPENMDTCMKLRAVGYVPYARIRINGRDLECISFPYPPEPDTLRTPRGIRIMLRKPDEPSSMFSWRVPQRILRMLK